MIKNNYKTIFINVNYWFYQMIKVKYQNVIVGIHQGENKMIKNRIFNLLETYIIKMNKLKLHYHCRRRRLYHQ